MHVRLSQAAKDDLQGLEDYLKPRSTSGLQRIQSAIFMTMLQLETFPLLGRSGDVEGTHELTVPRTPYRLIYRINAPYYVEIIRVLHGRLKYPLED